MMVPSPALVDQLNVAQAWAGGHHKFLVRLKGLADMSLPYDLNSSHSFQLDLGCVRERLPSMCEEGVRPLQRVIRACRGAQRAGLGRGQKGAEVGILGLGLKTSLRWRRKSSFSSRMIGRCGLIGQWRETLSWSTMALASEVTKK